MVSRKEVNAEFRVMTRYFSEKEELLWQQIEENPENKAIDEVRESLIALVTTRNKWFKANTDALEVSEED